PIEHDMIERLAGCHDGFAGERAELLDRPGIRRHPNDGAVQQATLLEAVEGVEGHDPGQVAGNAEDDQHISLGRRGASSAAVKCRGCSRGLCVHVPTTMSPVRLILRARPVRLDHPNRVTTDATLPRYPETADGRARD